MSHVVIEKILDKISDSVQRCIDNLGGIKNFLEPDETILIKPNFVGPISSDQGATTDLQLVLALAKIAIENRADTVYIAESPATCFSTQEVFEDLGIVDLFQERTIEKLKLVDLNQEKVIKVTAPNDFFLKNVPVPELLTKVDRIWNVPKAKVHYVDTVTCAVKNYVGFLPSQFRLSVHQNRLSHVVAIMHKLFPSSLVVADASIVGSGEGPLNVKPVQFGYLVASSDPVAVDSVIGKLFGFEPEEIEFVMNAHNFGVGDINPSWVSSDESILKVCKEKPLVRRPVRGIIGRYKPFRIILGGACYGCLTWLKGALEGWILDGTMEKIEKMGTKITVMVGYNAVDERFDEFAKNPYVVVGDCAPAEYKNDPRVIHVSGCCPGEKIQLALEQILFKG